MSKQKALQAINKCLSYCIPSNPILSSVILLNPFHFLNFWISSHLLLSYLILSCSPIFMFSFLILSYPLLLPHLLLSSSPVMFSSPVESLPFPNLLNHIPSSPILSYSILYSYLHVLLSYTILSYRILFSYPIFSCPVLLSCWISSISLC